MHLYSFQIIAKLILHFFQLFKINKIFYQLKKNLACDILRLRRVAICDMFLIRRSAILAEHFLCNGNEVSYYIKKPGIPQHSIPEFRSVNHQSGSVMTYFFGSFPEMPSSAHWKASLYLPLDSLCSILRIFPDQSYDKAICGSV